MKLLEEATLGAGKTFKEPMNSLAVTMLVDAWITKDGTASPTSRSFNITAGMPAEWWRLTAYAQSMPSIIESLEGCSL